MTGGDHCASGYAFDPARDECVACDRPCQTGMKGICSRGTTDCSGAAPACRASIQPGERRELCNGEDDDCDGQADEDFDKDRDSYSTCGGDCNDRDPAIHPDAAERCDAIDNNCNGLADEGFNIGGTCSVGQGECRRGGHLFCGPDGLSSLCDAKPGPPAPEACDGRDDDCNGKIDDGLGELSCGIGACQRTVGSCGNGKAATCTPGDPIAELCGDGIDNNCNGKTDEGFPELGKSCYEGVGACRVAGKMICGSDGLSVTCSARPSEPRAEICGNGIDDDCDGTVDTDAEGIGAPCANASRGECSREGTMVCDAKTGELVCSASSPEPQAEVCDGRDNDCDGRIDEGVQNSCGGCSPQHGEPGAPCVVEGGGECATGRWSCSEESKGDVVCVLDPKQSAGRGCASDGNPCTRDVCEEGACRHPPAANGNACDDANRCTERDVCIGGECAGGTMIGCDDGNACTEDSCDEVLGCSHRAIGTGTVNACGGCDALARAPGEACEVAGLFGPCREGRFSCLPEGGSSCVQTLFARAERCNGVDDDCNGEADNGLGTTSCGIGACQVEVANCQEGREVACVPKDPQPESCGNPGSDDDCNGVIDDVAGIRSDCPVAIGTCIIPGAFTCVGDAEKPVCVPVNPRDAEDEDGNGIANYCDRGDSLPSGVEAEVGERLAPAARPAAAASRLFDASRTRAVMLPWRESFGAAIVGGATPENAVLLVSGASAGVSGMAVLRAKDALASGGLSFLTCSAPGGEEQSPRRLLPLDDGGLLAAAPKGYLIYSKLASRIASGNRCQLAGQPIGVPAAREWPGKSGLRECPVTAVADIAVLDASPLSFAGAVVCDLPPSTLIGKTKPAVGIDVLSREADGSFTHAFVPFAEAASDVKRVRLIPLTDARGGGIVILAEVAGKNALGHCTRGKGGWSCERKELAAVAQPIAFAAPARRPAGRPALLLLTEGGLVFQVTLEAGGALKVEPRGNIDLKDAREGAVHAALELADDAGGLWLIGRDAAILAARVMPLSGDAEALKPVARERFEPQSTSDDVFSGGKFAFVRPHGLALLPLKGYGGPDLFAAYEMRQGDKRVGEMGFLYFNANEPPHGTIDEIRFDGARGSARLAFTDPTGDPLTFRAGIRAHHGGSLDHWIDGLEKGRLRFSVKGDPAAVGLWPVEITASASDPAGSAISVRAILRRDGSVEAITESSSNP